MRPGTTNTAVRSETTGHGPPRRTSSIGRGSDARDAAARAIPVWNVRVRSLVAAAAVIAGCSARHASTSGAPDARGVPGGAPPAPDTPVAARGAALPRPVPPSPWLRPAQPADQAPAVCGPAGELVTVGRRTIGAKDLGEFVLRWQPDVAADALRRLVVNAAIEAEAAREGVDVPAGAVADAADRGVAERVRRLRLESGSNAAPDDLLRARTGRGLGELQADLRGAVRLELLRERLVRLDARRRDGFDLRVLVVPDERDAEDAAAQWRRGADAEALARRLGVEAPAAPPAIAPDDVPDAALRARLGAAVAGDVLGPVPFEAEDPAHPTVFRTWWQVFKVVRTWKASEAPWRELAPEIEAALRDAPPRDAELRAWEARVLRRLGVAAWNADGTKGSRPSVPPGTIRDR